MSVQMRHDSHYVDEISAASRAIGKTIPIDSIYPNPEQPRTEFGDLSELTASIKEKGVLEPLLVVRGEERGKYMIIAGERRWRSSKLAGLSEVPCIEMELDEKGVAEIALIENLQRKDLTVWEEADGLAALAEKFGYTQGDIAQKISKSRSTVTELMAIAGLPPEIRVKCQEHKLNSKSALLTVARQFDEAAMYEYLDTLSGSVSKKPSAGRSEVNKADEASSSAKASKAKAFSYISPEAGFKVEVTFIEDREINKRNILQALKEAFDNVKADETEL